jgi:hypothetical protein
MVPELRRAYNQAFRDERYREMLRWLEKEGGSPVDFRVSETPVFLHAQVAAELERAAHEICAAVHAPAYLRESPRAIPHGRGVPGRSDAPVFLQIDFALASDGQGGVVPRLIELQGFPSLYGFQWHLARAYREHFTLPADWSPYFSGYDETTYAQALRRQILGDCDPEQVVLLEIEPGKQKTRIDFHVTERMVGLAIVDAAQVIRRGRALFYARDGREIPIRRIYNRVIFDEVDRKGIDLAHLFREETDAEWVGHPNWFFQISKWSLPWIQSEYCPPCRLVSDLGELPADLENYVLKPIYSFAGLGVEVEVTPEKVRAVKDPENWILQRKVEYAPVVETPDGFAKVEVRMMFLRIDGQPVLVNSLVRTSKGKMLGVDFNKDQTWIGASVAFHGAE